MSWIHKRKTLAHLSTCRGNKLAEKTASAVEKSRRRATRKTVSSKPAVSGPTALLSKGVWL